VLRPTAPDNTERLPKLASFANTPPASIKQIAVHMHVTSGSGSVLLAGMERAGYIRRNPSPNNRRSLPAELNSERHEAR
jgi:DNA-binding MarR family transcriptional regulator